MARGKSASLIDMKRLPVALLVGIAVFLVDAISKYLVVQTIPKASFAKFWYPYGGIGVFENFLGIEFSINHVTNYGAAWGSFSEHQDILLYLRIFMVLGIFAYLFFYNTHKEWVTPFALILAGAIGNIVDVFMYGHVIDMFHFVFWGYDYPVFNVADASIFIGIAWLVFNSWKTAPKKKKR